MKRERTNILLIALGLAMLLYNVACNDTEQDGFEAELGPSWLMHPSLIAEMQRCYPCFSFKYGYGDENGDPIYVDSIVSVTEKGNFFKKRSITDSTFVWTCGRGQVEYIIDTLRCDMKDGYRIKEFEWETEEFIGVIQGCGTYCWGNTIYPLNDQGGSIYLSYIAIDSITMNVVSVGNDSFQLMNLRSRRHLSIPITGAECVEGYLLFYVHDATINGTQISYTLTCGNGTEVPYTITDNRLRSL